jgi:tetratricopeptide (TPR) repeat protein
MRAWVMAALVLAAGVVRAEEPTNETERTQRSKAHFDRGRAAFNLGEYEEAVREWEEGYKWRPLPLFLYNMAEAEKRAGHLERALERYKRYLVVSPRAPERKSVEKTIASLEKQIAAKPPEKPPEPVVVQPPVEKPPEPVVVQPPVEKPPEPAPVEKPVEPPVVTQPPVAAPVEKPPEPPPPVEKPTTVVAKKPWHKDWLAPTLLGVGLAVLAGGAAEYGVFSSRLAAQSKSEQQLMDAQGAPGQMIGGTVLMVAGCALIVGSAIRWAVKARQ